MLRSLQAYRGIAAVMVVVFHANFLIWPAEKYFQTSFTPLFDFLESAVQLFFVLSGFIIMKVHNKDMGQRDAVRPFFLKRFIRIYPIFLIVLVSLVSIYLIKPDFGNGDERNFFNIITSLFLLPYPMDPIPVVAWTLKHEAFFYLIFAIIIFDLRVGLSLFVAWQVGCLINVVAGFNQFPYNFFFSANNLLFLLGMCIALISDPLRIKHSAALVAFGIVLLVATGLHRTFADAALSPSVYILGFGFAGAAMITGFVGMERKAKIKIPLSLSVLGDASYAIYLTHVPVQSLAAKVLFASGAAAILPQSVSFPTIVLVPVVAGVLFHFVVERPLTRGLKAYFHPEITRPSIGAMGVAGMPHGFLKMVSELTGRSK